MFCIITKNNIYPTYLSKHNPKREQQAILSMILNRENQWHYLKVKNFQHY